MKEVSVILKKLADLASQNVAAVLTTVVDVRGSSYRLPGAKMLVLESGETFGTVSGGCLEADVLERAKRVLRTGEASVFTYDTTDDENSVFSLNMGCRGVIRILLEPVAEENGLSETFQAAYERREPGVIGTLIAADSAFETAIGGRIFYSDSEQFYFKNLPDYLEKLPELREDCLRSLTEDKISQTKEYRTQQGNFEFFFENIKPPISLLIFGAGADAVPLVAIAENLGWQISVIDHRPAFLTEERFPQAENLILNNSEVFNEKIVLDEQTSAVVMTHNYERDRQILARLLKSSAFYIGALGPKRRTQNLLSELSEAGEKFSAAQLARLYAPVGLDVGADTPEGIALSIAAEIQSVLKQRRGGFLRERQGSIYNRSADSEKHLTAKSSASAESEK